MKKLLKIKNWFISPKSRYFDDIDLSKEWPFEFFPRSELVCRETGEFHCHPMAVLMLDELRRRRKGPVTLSSGYRSPAHSREMKKVAVGRLPGFHTNHYGFGVAFDIPCYYREVYELLELAIEVGFTGIGLKQKGKLNKRLIHIDARHLLEIGSIPYPTIFSY